MQRKHVTRLRSRRIITVKMLYPQMHRSTEISYCQPEDLCKYCNLISSCRIQYIVVEYAYESKRQLITL